MSTDLAIKSLVEFVADNRDWDEDALLAHLIASGISKKDAEDAVRFTGVGFGRLILNELGVELSNQYILFRADGSMIESGELDKNESFLKATQLTSDFRQHPGFKPLAYSSPEMDAVNQALEGGADPKDLVMGPVALFVEPATRAGFERAQEQITKLARAAANLPPAETSGSPWWKFW